MRYKDRSSTTPASTATRPRWRHRYPHRRARPLLHRGRGPPCADVCLIGDRVVQEFFPPEPLGKAIHAEGTEFTIVGTFEKIGAVLGQDQDNFIIIPLRTYLKLRGQRNSLTAPREGGRPASRSLSAAQDDARRVLRARRHVPAGKDDDFFIGTADSYISLWQSISAAFFSVFVMISSISAVVGGIVIMNVMLVSVTERTKEIGVRRAVGATQSDILRQFLTESVMQCLIGGAVGVAIGFGCALALREFTCFPASVQVWVATLGRHPQFGASVCSSASIRR